VTLQLTLIIGFNYSYGESPSIDFAHGGNLLHWLSLHTPRVAALAVFNEFGALYLLAPVGLLLASPSFRRLCVVAVPPALLFAYVQQPDRALWNFHFLVAPLAALTLAAATPAIAWAVVVCFVVANLRIGAQLAWAPASRYAVLASLLLSVAAIVTARRETSVAAPRPWTVAS
jgi:hypothetical protein